RDLERPRCRGSRCWIDLDHEVLVVSGRGVGEVLEGDVDMAAGEDGRRELVLSARVRAAADSVTAAERSRARDLLRSRPGDAAVMGYGVIDRRADVRALRTLREVRPRDDRVAVAPRGDVLLVERRFRRAEARARALRDARRN